jgi:hypothetical protein
VLPTGKNEDARNAKLILNKIEEPYISSNL